MKDTNSRLVYSTDIGRIEEENRKHNAQKEMVLSGSAVKHRVAKARAFAW